MDGLKTREQALAWAATWHPSFHGTAIVNKDFKFLAVNPQFCEILGVTPAELIGQKFTDVTPITVRELDVENARLVMSGKISSYLLPKVFEFKDGRKVEVVLLVVGVYGDEGEFKFFVSRIMEQKQPTQTKPSMLLSGILSVLKESTKNQYAKIIGWVLVWAIGGLVAFLLGAS